MPIQRGIGVPGDLGVRDIEGHSDSTVGAK